MRFPKQRFADETDTNTGSRSLDRGAQPSATSADDENVVFKRGVVSH
jgi:hypothetical protein